MKTESHALISMPCNMTSLDQHSTFIPENKETLLKKVVELLVAALKFRHRKAFNLSQCLLIV